MYTGIDKDNFEEFLGSRSYNAETKVSLLKHLECINSKVYRGLPFPLKLVKVGTIVEEWHGSSHWSKDSRVAVNYSLPIFNGYINEDYCKEMDITDKDLVPIVLQLEDAIGVDIHKIVQD